MTEALSDTCLLVEGLPESFSPENVAEYVASETQVTVKAVARAANKPDQAWVLLLESHGDQIHCLQNHSEFTVTVDDCDHAVRLAYPTKRSLPSASSQWTQLQAEGGPRPDDPSEANGYQNTVEQTGSALQSVASFEKHVPPPESSSGQYRPKVAPKPKTLETTSPRPDNPGLFPGTRQSHVQTAPSLFGSASTTGYLNVVSGPATDDQGYLKPQSQVLKGGRSDDTSPPASSGFTQSQMSIRSDHSYMEILETPSFLPDTSAPECPPPLPPRSRPQSGSSRLGTDTGPVPSRFTSDSIRSSADLTSRTIECDYHQAALSADVIRQYFQSICPREGDVESFTTDAGRGIGMITFSTISVAQHVVGSQHAIDGKPVQVRMCLPPRRTSSNYSSRFLFQGVPENTDHDKLQFFLELVSKAQPKEILYSDNPGEIVVTFYQPADLTKVKKECSERPLEGKAYLSVLPLPASKCILVENLNPKTTEETVSLYFESPRSSGGPVEKVVMLEDTASRMCLVHFHDQQVAERVLTKSHTISKQDVTVRRYHECLGPRGGSTDPNDIPLPKLVSVPVDQTKLSLIQSSPEVAEELGRRLADVHAKFGFLADQLKIECTVTGSTPNPRQAVSHWNETVNQTVAQFLDSINVTPVKIPQSLWEEVERELMNESLYRMPQAMLILERENAVCIVVGLSPGGQKLFELVSRKVDTLRAEANRKCQITTEPVPLRPYEIYLLQAVSFEKELMERVPDIEFKFDLNQQLAVLNGLPADITETRRLMTARLKTMKSKKLGKLSDRQIKMLFTEEAKCFIEEELASFGIIAVFERGKGNDVLVYAFDDERLGQAVQVIKRTVCEEEIIVTDSVAQENLQSREFMTLAKGLERSEALWVTYEGKSIFVTGRMELVANVKAKLNHFLTEKDIVTQIVRFSPSRQKLIRQFCREDLEVIQNSEELKKERVKITLVNDGRGISVKGTQLGLQLALNELEKFDRERIICHEEKLSDKTEHKFLTSKHCSKHLERIGLQHTCVVSLQFEAKGFVEGEDEGDAEQDMTVTEKRTSDVIEKSYVTSPARGPTAPTPITPPARPTKPSQGGHPGIHTSVLLGEIAKESADVIVNTTSSDLDLSNGAVSSSILKVAGSSLQNEISSKYPAGIKGGQIARTKGHNLSCKEIFHLTLESWNPTTSGQILEVIIQTCLEEASKRNYTSIAFPALGTGALGYPGNEVARILFSAVNQFQKARPSSSLREVKIVVYMKDQGNAQIFQQEQRKFQQAPAVLPKSGPPRSQAVPSRPPAPRGGSAIKISIIDGPIASQQVHVIVNTTSRDLDLTSGAVSSSILKGAGSGIQLECKQRYPRGIRPGEIASTRGHSLSCKDVFHIALDSWATGKEQELSKLIYKCLEKANQRQHTSISFPALGTGKLGYPPDIVAQTFFDTVDKFEQTVPTVSLRDVRIVIFRDAKTMQAFRNMEKQAKGAAVAPVLPHVLSQQPCHMPPKSSGRRQGRTFADDTQQERTASPNLPSETPAVDSFDFRGITVEIVKGELTEQAVDVIVVPVDANLQIVDENVRNALRQKCGDKVEEALRRKGGDLQRSGSAVTVAENMKSARIMFLNMDTYQQDLEKALTKCLKDADAKFIKRVAMPPIGAGDDNAHVSSKALRKALTKFSGEKRRLDFVRVVTLDWFTLRTYRDVLQDTTQEGAAKLLGYVKSIPKMLKGLKDPSTQTEAAQTPVRKSAPAKSPPGRAKSLFVYALQRDSIDKAVASFKEHVAERVYVKSVPIDEKFNIRAYNTAQVAELQAAGLRYDVEVNVDTQTGMMTLRGDHDDIIDAQTEINRILNAARDRHNMDRAVSRTASYVQWYVLEVTRTGTEQLEYAKNQNHQIEEAYLSGEKTVRLKDTNGVVYIIDFDSMMEYPEDDPNDVASVIRRDKQTGDSDRGRVKVPGTWTPQDPNSPVDVIELRTDDQEYKGVLRNLLATKGGHNVTVKSVFRIQNQTLYQQYAAKKAHLELQNPGIQNERTLWHGTSGSALININNYGFSRSYCGKNATVYGEGVYFAVNAEYSLNPTYTPADTGGLRYIYQCKVLTGYYTSGKQGMRFLPNRQGPILYDSAVDDTKKPEMYIVFNDTQAYPEYLITFQ